MRSDIGRIGRFIAAARRLMLAQLAAAVVALALAVWAFVAVRELAVERDQLRAQLAQVEQRGPSASATPVATPPTASEPAELPPAPMPFFIPIPVAVESAPPAAETVTTPAPAPAEPNSGPGTPDCAGANAGQPGCRRGRWSRPVLPVAPQPQQPANQQGAAPQR